MAILRIKDADGNVTEVLALRGEPGKSGVLTVNGVQPDESGNVVVEQVSDEQISNLIETATEERFTTLEEAVQSIPSDKHINELIDAYLSEALGGDY